MRLFYPLPLLLALSGCGPAENPPNVVLLIGDDHGHPYLGFTGSEHVHTPHLDRLAREDAVFHLGHVMSNQCRRSLRTLRSRPYPLQFDLMADSLLGDAAPEWRGHEAALRC